MFVLLKRRVVYALSLVVMLSMVCVVPVVGFSGEQNESSETTIPWGGGLFQGNIDLSYNGSYIPNTILPEYDVVRFPVEINYFVSGLGSRSVIPFLWFRTVPIWLAIEHSPEYLIASMEPEVVCPHLRIQKTEFPEISWVSAAFTREAPGFQTISVYVCAEQETLYGFFGFLPLIASTINRIPIQLRAGYYHDLEIEAPSEVYTPSSETTVFEIFLTNNGNARTQVRFEIVEIPEGWTINIPSEVFVGTPVLHEENTVTIEISVQPPSDFSGNLPIDFRFISSAAGHPEAGIYPTLKTITFFSDE